MPSVLGALAAGGGSVPGHGAHGEPRRNCSAEDGQHQRVHRRFQGREAAGGDDEDLDRCTEGQVRAMSWRAVPVGCSWCVAHGELTGMVTGVS